MRRQGLLALAVFLLAFAGCGGDDGDEGGDLGEEAQQAVTETIAAYEAGDYEAMCELQDARVTKSITSIAKTDTCAEGYEKIFNNQKAFGGVGATSDHPFDDFVDQLGDYEVGEATINEDEDPITGEVALDGPEDAVSVVVQEDGVMKVSELFVTPDANNPAGTGG